MKRDYPYLKDTGFLYLADTQRLQTQFVKLTLLDWNENPLQEIQGIATGGTISINGSSAIRRTCNLSMTVKDVSTGRITDVKNLISINKKVYVEIGIVNRTNKYTNYDILWYPQGTFVFTQCSVSTDLGSGTNLSAQLKDKMCLLNGECGGVITSSVVFDKYDTIDTLTGEMITIQPTLTTIIKELVNHFGKEDLTKIVINDIEERIKMVMRWLGDNPIYLTSKGESHTLTTSFANAKQTGGVIQQFNYGEDVGFIYTDFVWSDKDLTANAGDNVCTILDKIKNLLGNFEYFYDVDGNFVFQEIKNYLNTTQATVDLANMNNDDYVINITDGKSVYDFSDNKLVINFSNSPQYTKIKNDFVVWGIRETATGLKLPIRYHLAIDTKPETGKIYEVFFYDDPNDGLRKAKCPLKYQTKALFPEIGAEETFYLDTSTNAIYRWNGTNQKYISIDGYTYEEYSTMNNFPNLGEFNKIYVDLSTTKKYIWTLNPGSIHYKAVANQLKIEETNYNTDIKTQQNLINQCKKNIANYKKQIEDLDKQFSKYLTQIKSLNTKIQSCKDTQKKYDDEINELRMQAAKEQDAAMKKAQDITVVSGQIQNETDTTKLAELNAEFLAYTNSLEAAQATVQEISTEIAEQQAELANLQLATQIQAYEEQQALIRQQYLQDYEAQVAAIEQHILVENNHITQCENNIEAIKQGYETTKTSLLFSQNEYIRYKEHPMVNVQATDWRSELYLSGATAAPLGLETNYYYAELEAEWPKLYNLQADYYTDNNGKIIYTGAFYEDILTNPWNVDYWLDFIDSDAEISELNVNNIGRRSLAKSSNDLNCVFESEIPDIVIIETGDSAEAKREECERRNQDYCQVNSNIYSGIGIGGLRNSCFNEIKNLLWEYTKYNSNVNISLMPIYHLEPNTRVTIQSNEADIHGDFMMNSLSIPLDINGTMSISATQVQTKL